MDTTIRCVHCRAYLANLKRDNDPVRPAGKYCRRCDRRENVPVSNMVLEYRPTRGVDPDSLECLVCEVAYPYDPAYEECPWCREPTLPSGADPLPSAQAHQRASTGAFGWWLLEQDLLKADSEEVG